MAAATETTDEFKELLTCSICLELFRNPKYLPCLHTFCQVCINTYISSSLHENKKGINCPVCRKFVTLEETSDKPETWAAELPTHSLISSMISLNEIRTSEKLCDGCQYGDETKPAISWCTVCTDAYCVECAKYHKKFRISVNHRIISLEEFQSGKFCVDKREFVACDKYIEVYCVDHCKPCCTVCATVIHRKCENVISIDKAVSGIKTAAKTVQLQKQLQQFTQQLEISMKKKQDNISEIERETTNIRNQTDNFTDDMIEHIRKIKAVFDDNLLAKKKEVLIALDEEKEEILSFKSTVATWKSILDTCLKYGSGMCSV